MEKNSSQQRAAGRAGSQIQHCSEQRASWASVALREGDRAAGLCRA